MALVWQKEPVSLHNGKVMLVFKYIFRKMGSQGFQYHGQSKNYLDYLLTEPPFSRLVIHSTCINQALILFLTPHQTLQKYGGNLK